MIKLIASDIDGTLVRDGEHKLDPEYFDVILGLRKRGYSSRRPADASGPALRLFLSR